MEKKLSYRLLLFFIVLFSYCELYAQVNNNFTNKLLVVFRKSNQQSHKLVLQYWDSLYFNGGKNYMYHIAPIEKWIEHINSIDTSQLNLTEKLNKRFALATISHSQAKFIVSSKHFEYLIRFKNILPKEKFNLILIKLEESYRALFLFDKALFIREMRIKRKLINTYWQLYQDYGLFDLAIQDFNLFEKSPPIGTYDHIRYLNIKSVLFLGARKLDEAIKTIQEGYELSNRFYFKNKKFKEIPDLGAYYWIGQFEYLKANYYFLTNNNKSRELVSQALLKMSGHYKVDAWFLMAQIEAKNRNSKNLKLYLDSVQIYREIVNNNYALMLLNNKNLQSYFEILGNPVKANEFKLKVYEMELLQERFRSRFYKEKLLTRLSSFELSQRRIELRNSFDQLKEQAIKIAVLLISLISISVLFLLSYFKYRQKKKIALLITNQNLALQKQSYQLKQQTDYAHWLLKELNHRVKNNLQVVLSMINMHRRRIKNANTEELFQPIQMRIQSIALLHQLLYQDNDGSSLNFKIYIQNLLSHLNQSFSSDTLELVFSVDIEDIYIDSFYAMPLGLILAEAVSNTYKYAYPEVSTGSMEISLREREDYSELIIKDFGRGFDVNNTSKFNLGLKLINILVKQIKANLTLHSKEGVTYIIHFKK